MLSDKHGLKYFMIAGPLVTSIFLSTLGILPDYYLILILLFLGNLGVAAFHPASAAIAGHYGGKRKGIEVRLSTSGVTLVVLLDPFSLFLYLKRQE